MTVQEIIYTSAQKGLKPGSTGFCTVVCTAGIDQRTASRLEGLSGYRHPFEINDPRNPVNFQHITMRVGAANTHVMSRVCDAGPDHTGRTNKLAHHIAFTQPPSPSGPARLFKSPGLFASQWDGKTSQRAAPTLPSVPLAAVTLSAWAALTKDGGWAGHLAEQLVSSKQPVYVLFPAGTDTLSLLTEVLDVVPASRRWAVTFSTYYTNPIAGAECQLRFVLDGTKDATKLRNDARAVIVDLTTPLPKATGGELVTLARSGVVPQTVVAAKKKPQPKPGSSKPSSGKPAESIDDDWMEPEADDFSSVATSGVLSPPQVGAGSTRPQAPNLFGAQRALKEQRLAAAGQPSGKGKVIAVVFGVLLLLGSVTAGVWIAVFGAGTDIGGEELVAEGRKSVEETQQVKTKTSKEKVQAKKSAITPKPAASVDKDPAPESKVVESKPAPPELIPEVKQPLDVFGEQIADGVAISTPVVLVQEWQEKSETRGKAGVDIPVDAGADFKLKVLHHDRTYDIKQEGVDREWAVMGGVGNLTKVATISRPTDERLVLQLESVTDPISRSVLQIDSEDRCGFVIFQKPQQQKAFALAEILEAVTDDALLAEKTLSVPDLSGDFVQTVEIKDNSGQLVTRENVKLRKDDTPLSVTFARKTSGKANNRIAFHFANGPTGAEHRHIISLLRNKRSKGTVIEYRLEFAKRDDRQVDPLKSIEARRQWLTTHLPRFRKNHTERDWEKVERKADAWVKNESQKLSIQMKRIESGLIAIRNHEANGRLQAASQLKKDKQDEAKKSASDFKEMEPQAAVLDLVKNKRFSIQEEFIPTIDIQSRDEIAALSIGIKQQAQAAKKSRAELKNYRLHFSVYLTINEVRIPSDLRLYRLRIPVIEFTDRNDESRLDWNTLAEISEKPAKPSPKNRGVNSPVQAVPKADSKTISP